MGTFEHCRKKGGIRKAPLFYLHAGITMSARIAACVLDAVQDDMLSVPSNTCGVRLRRF